uniref:Uncharacterized protein n=1 Tax=viral metagenome TaxID=1070528 RepID=A0A6M3J2X5_9ZZZZ
MPEPKRRPRKPRRRMESIDRRLIEAALSPWMREFLGDELRTASPEALLLAVRVERALGGVQIPVGPIAPQKPPQPPTRTDGRTWTPAPTVLPDGQGAPLDEAGAPADPLDEVSVPATGDPRFAPIGHYDEDTVRSVVMQAMAISTNPEIAVRIARDQLTRCEPRQEAPASSIMAQIEAKLKKHQAFAYQHPLEDMSSGAWVGEKDGQQG